MIFMNEHLNETLLKQIASEQNITLVQVKSVLALLEEGNTIPFIARYRKEATNGLDEEQIQAIHKEFEYGQNLAKRKEDVIRLIEEKGMMTDDLRKKITESTKLVEVEDLYRPYKEKKKTKATEAIALGLEPLAKQMMAFPLKGTLDQIVTPFVNENVDFARAIEGAKHIIAEWISDNAQYRKWLRTEIFLHGNLVTKVKKNAEDEMKVYQMYYDYSEPVKSIRPHRVLAVNRAESEKVITVNLEADRNKMVAYLEGKVIRSSESFVSSLVKEAIEDALKRLIYPSIEREVRSELSEKAEDQAIEIFSVNLKNLLLQPPMKGKVVLGVDPAYRTGCKMTVVDQTGKVLEKTVIYPHEKYKGAFVPPKEIEFAEKTIATLINKYQVEVIAIGNGTASRETEVFFAATLKKHQLKASYLIVNEAGASVYSASDLAREEFPDYEVEERSAVSIARRLQDPLSELVKIDPKSIGVGQYQHDVTPAKLNNQLNHVVVNAVNAVGVNVNTASKALLMYVSGLNKGVAENIVKHREENGLFKSRKDIKKVSKLGAKTFEQSIGFLRIPEGDEPLDMTSIHPESYATANAILKKYKVKKEDIGKPQMKLFVDSLDRPSLMEEFAVDKFTLDDILDAFVAPLRDPRDSFDKPLLRSDILHLEDLKPGMELHGTVRNVVDFGAFVDCGLKEDGLVHISKLSNRFIKHPSDVVSVGDLVKVWVEGVDLTRKKVSLTMKEPK